MRARALPHPGPAAADDDPLRRFLETLHTCFSSQRIDKDKTECIDKHKVLIPCRGDAPPMP